MRTLTEKVKAVVDKPTKKALIERARLEQRSEAAIVRLALTAYLRGDEAK